MKFKKMLNFTILILLTLGHIMVGCKDSDGHEEGDIDPSKPVLFSDFSPKEGAVRTRVYIDGSNFGTDASNFKVTIGGVESKVIGADNNVLYCTVPPRAYEGTIVVTAYGKNGEVIAEHQFEEPFNYVQTTAVGTLVGKADPNKDLGSNSSMINGSFEEAEFELPFWLQFDKTPTGEKHLYVCETSRAVRRVDLTNETVSTLFTNGQGMFRALQTFTFDASRDTMFFADDHGQQNKNLTVLSYAVRSENFRNVYPYIYDRTGYSCAVNPLNGDVYYNTWWDAAVTKARSKYNETENEWEGEEWFKLSTNGNAHTYIHFHPDGLYAYITGGFKCIMKSEVVFNEKTGSYDMARVQPNVIAGSKGSGGYEDSPGTQARFQDLRQGVFVKNEEYVKAGKKDVYDFYVVDEGNHCIRIVTPESYVSTFAGRGSANVDGNKWGYIDGKLREEARFRDPTGIAYDEETETFYIADKNNKRIRVITVQ